MEPSIAPHRVLEPTAVDRKIVLSRILAVAEAERLELSPTEEEVKATARWWRSEFGLLDLESFARWLRYSGMDLPAFWQMMRDFTALTKVLQHHGAEVDARMLDHLRIHTVRTFVGEGRT